MIDRCSELLSKIKTNAYSIEGLGMGIDIERFHAEAHPGKWDPSAYLEYSSALKELERRGEGSEQNPLVLPGERYVGHVNTRRFFILSKSKKS